jgi:hypothetical protein
VNTALPGISKHYGTRPVMINYDVKKIENVKISSKSTMEGYMTIDLNFWVNTTSGAFEEAASITLSKTDFSFDLEINNMTATM